ncbi:MAG: hypothetical protein PF444_09060 [Bacteroidales bacterium]|jgi:hypothetical protein|nr:hypothetical protein [Bacteroidales bacterium]
MASKRAYIMLTIGLTCLGALSAQDMDKSEADTVKIETDSAWHFDSSFGEQLAIPSFEELLETFFEAVVKVDIRLKFNPYRFQPGNTEAVNPFVYKDIIFPKSTLPNLEIYEDGFIPKDAFESNAEEVLWKSRSYISETKPELITVTWEQLPDPPKTEKQVNIIYNVDLDMSLIDKKSQKIDHPDKIEKQRYAYSPWE